MRTVRFLVLAALLAGVPAGCCCGPAATTGWRFEVGRPGTLQSPVTVQQMEGPIAVGGLATGAVSPSLAMPVPRQQIIAAAPPIDPCAQAYYPAQVPGAVSPSRDMPPPCTLQDICDMLRDIKNRLPAAASATKAETLPKPLPPGPRD